jgi:hypothetical protein
VSATDDKLPPEAWNPDGTITREGCTMLRAFNALYDRVRERGWSLEYKIVTGIEGASSALIVVDPEVEAKDRTKRIKALRPITHGGLEAAALALLGEAR